MAGGAVRGVQALSGLSLRRSIEYLLQVALREQSGDFAQIYNFLTWRICLVNFVTSVCQLLFLAG
jgi:hypothetical protein